MTSVSHNSAMRSDDGTDRLSPERHRAVPVELPWGLAWDDLRCCLPDRSRPIGAFATHEIRGLHRQGRSQILTIRYRQPDGRQRDRTIFLKLTDPRRPEASKYRCLAAHRAPIPRLIGSATTSAGETLVLEFLPTIGTTAGQADDLLELIAEINTIEHPPIDIFSAPAGDPEYGDRIRRALVRLLPDASDAGRWLDGYGRAGELVAQLPLALNHNELSFQQVGWAQEDEQRGARLLVFDLESMSLQPQYTDIAGILPDLAAQTHRTERDLFRTYLQAVDRRAGGTTDPGRAWTAMRIVRIVRTFEALPWLITMIDTPQVEAPDEAVGRLGRDLADAGLLAPGNPIVSRRRDDQTDSR